MESAAKTSASDQTLSAMSVNFLVVAVDVYRFARAIYETDVLPDATALNQDSLKLCLSMTHVIQQLKLNKAEHTRESLGFLIRASVKICEDLLIHLTRFEALVSGSEASSDLTKLRTLWPIQDVDALESRLRDMVQRWQLALPSLNLPSTFHIAPGTYFPEPEPIIVDEPTASPVSDPTIMKPLFGKNLMGMPKPAPRPPPTGLLNDFILDSLAYKSMRDREEEVTEAHGETLEWIFDKSSPSHPQRDEFSTQFTTWLKTTQLGPIYWITGKPGSGKSTLMRFLSKHPATMKHLQAWAANRPLCTAGFFFWTSGSRDQRSQVGLLRSLLHQLLSANPELMPSTFPDLWQKLRTMTTKERVSLGLDWTAADLMKAYHSFMDVALPNMNICLFIDGLDEFDGDHHAIVDFFKSLSLGEKSKAVKMCLSSRPWSVFEEAFQHAVPSTRLQDLTYGDMLGYAGDKLRGVTPVRRLLRHDEKAADELLDAIVQQADGVFLWVRLAVEKILNVFQQDFTISEMASVLATLPTELDDLFHKLLFEDQTSSQISDTATLFQLIRAREIVANFIKDDSATSLSVWELAFSLDENDNTSALDLAVQEATDSQIERRCERTAKFVHQRFAGLLSLHLRRSSGNVRVRVPHSRADFARSLADHKVTYIHRTVRDWLMESAGVYDRLKSCQPPAFDAHLRLLRSYVMRLKLPLEEVEQHRRLDEWYPDIALAMTHARHIENDPEHLHRPFLNELDKTISWYWLPKPSDPLDHWARSTFGAYEIRMKAPAIRQPFLCLSTKFGLTKYVSEELDARNKANGKQPTSEGEKIEENDSTPLLAYATEFLCSRNKTIFPLSDPQLVQHLLANPSPINPGPNDGYADFTTRAPLTPWLALLRHLRTAHRRGWIEYYDVEPEGIARWAEIVRLFIEVGGADVNAVVKRDAWDPEITAVGVLNLLEETYGAVEAREMKALLLSKQQDV
ncbi:hypothetical protein G7046_g3992 [Stylonectria norvegica]|nr:hypothetical protein G7046_g3992 [Stylonectria norvegica]